jgi:uncharacterized protein YbbC (DUF1343 family)
VIFRPLTVRPTFHKFAGQPCGGVQLHVTDRRTFLPLRTGIAMLAAARAQAPRDFAWRTKAYEFVEGTLAIDLLAGTHTVREGIDQGTPLADIVAPFAAFEREFLERRAPALLYS